MPQVTAVDELFGPHRSPDGRRLTTGSDDHPVVRRGMACACPSSVCPASVRPAAERVHQRRFHYSRRCPWRDARATMEIRHISTISPRGTYF
jgi:hypothetical protein